MQSRLCRKGAGAGERVGEVVGSRGLWSGPVGEGIGRVGRDGVSRAGKFRWGDGKGAMGEGVSSVSNSGVTSRTFYESHRRRIW